MKKVYSYIAAGAAVALTLTACGSGSGKSDVSGGSSKSSISFTTGADEYGGYNSLISSAYSTGNSAINDRMMPGFGYYDATGTWKHGTDLGDYEKVSDSPLTVKYTVNEKAVYQGGTPITCEDFYMDWTAQNPKWIMDAQKAAGVVDAKTGEAAPLFDHVSNPDTYSNPVAEGPACEAGDKTFTVTYTAPNPDWELVVSGPLPSHVIAKKLGMSKEDLFKALKSHDYEVAKKVAELWNNWYSPTPGVLQPTEEIPSWGPYTLKQDGWKKGEYVTLVRNPDWWGKEAATEEIVVKQLAPEAQLQALKNGDVNVIEPQATQDTIEQINAMGDAVKLLQGDTMIWEHLDFNRGDNSIMSDSKGGAKLREAFAYCVPRQDIVDKLIKPLNDKAVVMNAREYFPKDADYDEVVSKAYDGRYDKVDIEKSKALVAESGIANPVVRIGYSAPNQRRTDEVALIAESCAQAGITVQDIGSADFFNPGGVQDLGNYDVSLFAWSGSGQKVSGANIYQSTGAQNFVKYNDKVVDDAWAEALGTLDENRLKELKITIEKELWDSLHGIPLFAHPGIAAHTAGIDNIKRNPTQTGVVWNAEQWAWAK